MNQRTRKRQSPLSHAEQEADLFDEAGDVVIDGVVEMLAGIHRSKQRRNEAGERRAPSHEEESQKPRVAIESDASASDLLFDFARLQLGIVKQVLAFQRKHRDILIDRLRGPAASLGGSEAPMLLKGKVGETVNRSFVVENRSSERALVSLHVSELRSHDGKAPFRAEFDFNPEKPFDLHPDREREVGLSIVLDAEHFHPGGRYRCDVEISMVGRPKQRLPLRIDVAREDDPAGHGRAE